MAIAKNCYLAFAANYIMKFCRRQEFNLICNLIKILNRQILAMVFFNFLRGIRKNGVGRVFLGLLKNIICDTRHSSNSLYEIILNLFTIRIGLGDNSIYLHSVMESMTALQQEVRFLDIRQLSD